MGWLIIMYSVKQLQKYPRIIFAASDINMTEYTGRCLKCKSAQAMVDVEEGATKKGQPLLRGKCAICGTRMAVFKKRTAVAKPEETIIAVA